MSNSPPIFLYVGVQHAYVEASSLVKSDVLSHMGSSTSHIEQCLETH